jgi:hypothetical protein
MIYRHQHHAYAIGMAWSDFVGRSEARAHLKRACRPYVLADVTAGAGSSGGDVALGLAPEPRLQTGVASGAMAIGRLFPDAVIRQSLSDGRVWVARLSAGIPCSGRDELLDSAQAAVRLAEQALRDAVVVGDADGARLSVDEALALYEAQVDDGRIGRAQARAIRLQRAPSLKRPLVVAAVLLLVAGAVTASLWNWRAQLHDAQSRRAAFARLTTSQEQARRREAERQQRLAAFRKAVEEKRLALAQEQEDPRVQWTHWEQARSRLPLSVHGWVPDAMDCDRTQCTVFWKAAGPRVRLVDQTALANWIEDGPPTFAPRSRVDLPLAAGSWTELWQGGSAAALQLALAQALQFEGGTAGLGSGRVETVAAPPELGLAPAAIGVTGELRLAASGPAALIRAGDAIRALHRLPVRLQSLHWSQLAGSPAMTLEARWIYVNQQ